MNKRILKFAEQAGSTHKQNLGVYQFYTNELEKFAELIVREVFAKIEDERFEVYEPVKEAVMKHLGVEE